MKALLLLAGVPLLFAQDAAVIEGSAFNRLTNAPVAGVVVELALASATAERLYTATSDATGAFRIADVKEGDYVASFQAPRGYLPPQTADPECKPFHAARGAIVRLKVPMRPLGSVRGRVLDPDGKPVPRVRVELFKVHYAGGAIMTTDARGEFSEDGLIPGYYQLRARPVLPGTPLGRKPEDVSPLAPKPPEGEGWIWAPTYYPDSIDISGAETIAVHEGSGLSGYEIHLRSAPVYHLRGTVSDDEGKPAGGVKLFLLSEIGWGRAEAQAESGKDGGFEFPAVRAGDWRITAEAQRGTLTWVGSVELRMPQHDFDDVKVNIDPPFALDGKVEGAPPGKLRPMVELEPVISHESPDCSLGDDGTLHCEKVYPGRYQIIVLGHIPGYYLKSVLVNDRDVRGQEVSLDRGTPPIRVILKPNAPRVRGTVEDGAGAVAVLIDADQDHTDAFQAVRATRCDGEGRFDFDGLYPATYYAFAYVPNGNVETGAVREAVFTLGLKQQAQTVRLEEGDTATLALKILPWPE